MEREVEIGDHESKGEFSSRFCTVAHDISRWKDVGIVEGLGSRLNATSRGDRESRTTERVSNQSRDQAANFLNFSNSSCSTSSSASTASITRS
jgi:hypothetical protein